MERKSIGLWPVLATATALGLGNALEFPTLLINSGTSWALVLHGALLVTLGFGLLVSETLWGQWLSRPLDRAFAVVAPPMKILAALSLLSILFLTPAYLEQVNATLRAGLGQEAPTEWERLFWSLLGWGVLCGLASLPPRKMLWAFVGLLSLGISLQLVTVVGVAVSDAVVFVPRSLPLHSMWAPQVSFALYSLSAGLGVHYLLAYQETQRRWKTGTSFQVAWIVIGLDLMQSVFSYVIVSPFLVLPTFQVQPTWALSVLPQWLELNFGFLYRASYFVGTALLGLLAASTLQLVSLHWVSQNTQWTRRRSALHVFSFGLIPVLFLPAFPKILNTLQGWVTDLFIPMLALSFLLGVLFRMPLESQRRLFGRGLLSEAAFPMWRAVSWALIPFLVLFFGWRYIS